MRSGGDAMVVRMILCDTVSTLGNAKLRQKSIFPRKMTFRSAPECLYNRAKELCLIFVSVVFECTPGGTEAGEANPIYDLPESNESISGLACVIGSLFLGTC